MIMTEVVSPIRLDAVDSTNREALRHIAAGAPHGTVIQARQQTDGRGRRGRLWISPPGNLYATLIVRPPGDAPLAQLGFIVIQVGHRGGTPKRSKAYGSYGYFNMRDYGLEDKKTAIEQLAARHDFIDIDRTPTATQHGTHLMAAPSIVPGETRIG